MNQSFSRIAWCSSWAATAGFYHRLEASEHSSMYVKGATAIGCGGYLVLSLKIGIPFRSKAPKH